MKIKRFRDLPQPYQRAIVHYMIIDGDAWIDDNIKIRSRNIKKHLPYCIEKYGHLKFGMEEISTEKLKEKILERPDLEGFKKFEDYHAWYKKDCGIPKYSNKNRWACIAESEDVLQDGWHRFHSYVDAGHKTIPLVHYIKNEKYY